MTDHPVGLLEAVPTLDGEGVLWFQDETGDESGRWLVQPFDGGETTPFLEGVPHGWNERARAGAGDRLRGDLGSRRIRRYMSLEADGTQLLRSSQCGSGTIGGFLRGALSADGTLLCIEHAEHGDLIHPALRVLDPRTGATVGDLLDEGMSLAAKCWSPVAGDQRLAFEHEREGDTRPALWNLATGEHAAGHRARR